MKNAEINALEMRFKATVLLLLNLGLLIDKYDSLVNIAQRAFDSGEFELSKKSLDILDAYIVEDLEIQN